MFTYLLLLCIFIPFPAAAFDVPGIANFWLLGSVAFLLGLGVAVLSYLFFRQAVEKFYDVVSRSSVGSFLPHFYHRDSIADHIYGYYIWDARDGFEYLSPMLRQLLRIDDGNQQFSSLRKALREEDFQALEKAAIAFREESIRDFSRLVQLTRADVTLECIGILRRAPAMQPGFTFWFRDVTSTMRESEALVTENQRLNDLLKQAFALCEKAPVAVWRRDESGKIVYGNAAYRAMVEENALKTLPELQTEVRELAQSASTSGKVQRRKLHIVSHGQRSLCDVHEFPAEAGLPAMGYAIDISEQESIENELKRYVAAQGEFLESSASAMAIYSADGRLKSYNRAFVQLWGLEEAWLDTEPTYGNVLERLRDTRRLPEQANFLQFKKENMAFFTTLITTQEEYYYLPDGHVLRVIIIPHALGGLLFAYEDVTDRLALERNYNTLIAVQRATLDHLHEGVAVFGEDGRLKLYNTEFITLLRLDPHALDAEPHLSMVIESAKKILHTEETWDGFRDRMIRQLTERDSHQGRLKLADGRHLEWFSVPLPDGAAMVTLVDITHAVMVESTLRDKNRALEEADRVKTEFLASMSYELRSPLTSIMGFSEALKRHYFGALNTKQQEYLEAINASSHKLMALINNILDLASIEAGYMKLSVTQFSIRTMLEDIYVLQEERLKQAHITLQILCDDAVGSMCADELRVKQVIFNLLHNAIKFSEEGSRVRIGVERQSDAIALWVEDEGEGMSSEEQSQVFERFYRGSSIKARKSGAGLGLSMVKRFVELHGGRVELVSQRGQGTKVTCVFPLEIVQAEGTSVLEGVQG